jgi:indole-3-glycerol phosphate synthase/phosphoribosylanthranilate isomerase
MGWSAGDRGDIERLAPHVNGFLIGSSVMRSPDPREAARLLAFGRVKLCGLRTVSDLRAAASACFAGLVMVPGTPRAISIAEAEAMLAESETCPPPVAILRDAPLEQAEEAVRRLPLHAVQLHGTEDGDYVRRLRRVYAGEIWLAGPPERTRGFGDRTLFDSGTGGTGRAFDWSAVRDRPELPRGLIGGGIGSSNAAAAARMGAYAIDVGSSVDERPGTKSAARIDALFDALRPSRAREPVSCE